MNVETEISIDLWAAVRRSYESQAWSNAILDGIYYLSDVIRSRTGLQSDGTALAGQAFGGKTPKLRLNKLQTESDTNVQAGVEQLVRGLYQAVRNPRSHERISDSQADADALLVFINYLLQVIGHARTTFSLDESVARALDENFVPNERYAALVLEEIPARYRLPVALAVFERRGQVNAHKLSYFFQAALERLSPEERAEFFSAISDTLRDDSDESTLRTVLQILKSEQWPEVGEAARLRSEHRLLLSFCSGRYNSANDKCSGGALATWCPSFWPHFILRNEFLDAAAEQIGSANKDTRDYIRHFFLAHLDSLATVPSRRIQWALAERLKKRDEEVYLSVKYESIWKIDSWNQVVKSALESYEEAEEGAEVAKPDTAEPQASSSLEDDDGIPF